MAGNFEELKKAKEDLLVAKAKFNAIRPWYRKKRFLFPAGFVFLFAILLSMGPQLSTRSPVPVGDSNTQLPNDSEESTETVNQQNARVKAMQYLQFSAFSRKGLIQQLEYEGFNTADAEYGTDAQNADWREQAAKKAKQYLQTSAFSKQGLIDQLLYEGFSLEDATYGVSTTGLS
jgi:hypothetical protein